MELRPWSNQEIPIPTDLKARQYCVHGVYSLAAKLRMKPHPVSKQHHSLIARCGGRPFPVSSPTAAASEHRVSQFTLALECKFPLPHFHELLENPAHPLDDVRTGDHKPIYVCSGTRYFNRYLVPHAGKRPALLALSSRAATQSPRPKASFPPARRSIRAFALAMRLTKPSSAPA